MPATPMGRGLPMPALPRAEDQVPEFSAGAGAAFLSILAATQVKPISAAAQQSPVTLGMSPLPVEAAAESPIEMTAQSPVEMTAQSPVEVTAQSRPWVTLNTKRCEALTINVTGPKGSAPMGRVAKLGREPDVESGNEHYDVARLNFVEPEELADPAVRAFLKEHLERVCQPPAPAKSSSKEAKA